MNFIDERQEGIPIHVMLLKETIEKGATFSQSSAL